MKMDRYGPTHLSKHLSRAGSVATLYELVTSRNWRSISTHADMSGKLFSEDIRVAFSAIHDILLNSPGNGDVENATRLAGLSWVSSKLGREASRQLNPNILEILARLEGWQIAVNRAEAIPNLNDRAEGLIWIGYAVYQSGEVDVAKQIWDQAIQLLTTQQLDYWLEYLEVLGELLTVVIRLGEKEIALKWYQEYFLGAHESIDQTGGVTSTVRFAQIIVDLGFGFEADAIEKINKIEDPNDRVKTYLQAAEFQNSFPASFGNDLLSLRNLYLSQDPDYDQSNLAIALAGAGEIDEAYKMIGNKADSTKIVWMLRSYIYYLVKSRKITDAKLQIEKVHKLLTSISDNLLRLGQCAEFIIGRQRETNETVFSDLLPMMQEDFDQIADQLDARYANLTALAFCMLGDRERATAAFELRKKFETNSDDWEETRTLIQMTAVLGECGDAERLNQILDIALHRQESWHTAEILLALANQIDHDLVNSTLKALWEDTAEQESRPNMLGSLAVWRFMQSNDIQELHSTLQRASKLLLLTGDGADGLAYLALTLAENGLLAQSTNIAEEANKVLENEIDENTLARVCGTLVDVSIELEDRLILSKLIKITDLIQDEPWLQAEAYLWLSAGYAHFRNPEKAVSFFVEGLILGSWVDIDETIVLNSWNSVFDAQRFFSNAYHIGWRSTQAAAIVAWISILVLNPAPWHSEVGLELVEQLPEEYSAKRALCFRLLSKSILEVSDPQRELLTLFAEGLHSSRLRDTGEMWAVVEGCFESLVARFGNAFVKALWDSIFSSRLIFETENS